MHDDHGSIDAVDASVAQWAEQWPELDVSPLEVFGRLHRVFWLYQAEISKVFAEHGINPPAFGVLAALYRSGSPHRLRVSALANQTLVTKGGMTQRLDRLESLGLIVRERDAADRRTVFARLTDSGLDCARAAARAHFANEKRMLKLVDQTRRDELVESLRLLETSLSASVAGPRE